MVLPFNQQPFRSREPAALSIFSSEAPLLQRSVTFSRVGQYFQSAPVSSVISAILLTLFVTKTLQGFSGFVIQYNATILSIHIVTDAIGHPFNARHTFLTMLAAMCPAISSSLVIVDFEVRSPLTVSLSCSATIIVNVEQARLLASANC